MDARIFTALGAGAVAAAVTVTFTLPAGASDLGTRPTSSTSPAHTSAAQPAPKNLCFSQLDNDNGGGVVSQNFEAAFDTYDAQGADDFKLRKKCGVKFVYVDGAYFNGSGPCASFTVTIYGDGGGTPSQIIGTGDDDRDGGTKTKKIKVKKRIHLPAGTYWVSAVCNMDFATGGEWGWNTNNTVRGTASQWQNPGDGFSTGCTTYNTTTACVPSGEGGDFSFAVGK